MEHPKSHKNSLQEIFQKKNQPIPRYNTTFNDKSGLFISTVELPDGKKFTGSPKPRKKDAELDSAQKACEWYITPTKPNLLESKTIVEPKISPKGCPIYEQKTLILIDLESIKYTGEIELICKHKSQELIIWGISSCQKICNPVTESVDKLVFVKVGKKEYINMSICLLLAELVGSEFENFVVFSKDPSLSALEELVKINEKIKINVKTFEDGNLLLHYAQTLSAF